MKFFLWDVEYLVSSSDDDVRGQVRIALPGDFPDRVFTPDAAHEADASTMFDQLEAWATAMRTIRS